MSVLPFPQLSDEQLRDALGDPTRELSEELAEIMALLRDTSSLDDGLTQVSRLHAAGSLELKTLAKTVLQLIVMDGKEVPEILDDIELGLCMAVVAMARATKIGGKPRRVM
jgi:hypothetical protein